MNMHANAWLAANGKKFKPAQLASIRSRLEGLSEEKVIALTAVELKDPTIILVLSIFLGYLGVDRFMIGDVGIGLLKLLTCGLCGILSLIDWFIIMDKTREYNYQAVLPFLS